MVRSSRSLAIREDDPLWAARIAARAELGDTRLESRFALILESLTQKPRDPIPQSAGDKHSAKAIYRFLSNRRFGHEQVIEAITTATAISCADLPLLYVVQDTTSLNYGNLKSATDLGPINGIDQARGMHLHSAIAVDANGVVQGALHLGPWVRRGRGRSAPDRRKLPIEEKESVKWIDALRGVRAAFQHCEPAKVPRLVHLMDREGDVHEVFEEIAEGEGFLIRCAQNRCIEGPIAKAQYAVADAPALGTVTLRVPAHHQQKARNAILEVRSHFVTLNPQQQDRGPVSLSLIEAREIDPPVEGTAIHWWLWTNLPASTLNEAAERLREYTLRWRVEEYHLVLKSGCEIEKLQLRTAGRLFKAVAIYAAVAARIVMLRDLGKHRPDAPCTTILRDVEWRGLLQYHEDRIPGPDEPIPTIRQAMRWIGQLGGHLGRKSDGLPGVRTLWRGWRDLALLMAGCRLAAARK